MTATTAPIAWMVYTLDGKSAFVTDNPADFTQDHQALPLYTTSPQRQPDPEPVAWMTINPYGEEDDISYEDPTMDLLDGWTCKPLYTQPPQREWIGLTDAELEEFSNMQLGAYDLCDAVEERLEEKNRG